MCGQTGPVKSTTAGTNTLINTISNTDNEFNNQLQGFLGSVANEPTANVAPISEGFSNFASTGAATPEQASAIKNEAADAARSTFSTASDQARRMIAATGGYGDIGAITTDLAREGSNAASRASSAANSQLTGNELQGLTGEAGLYSVNAQRQQSLINSLLQLFSTSVGGINSALGTQAGLAVAPGSGTIAANNLSNIVGSFIP